MRVLLGAMVVSVLVTMAVGCGISWDDVPGARLQPEVDGADMSLDDWSAAVIGAAAEWNENLEAAGCQAPFDLDATAGDRHPVRLVAYERWAEDPGLDGATYSNTGGELGRIDIRTDAADHGDFRSALLHEMGHAIGLEHQPRGVDSVMCIINTCAAPHVTPTDVAEAASALGCR